MNIKITHSWLLDYLDTDATPLEMQKYLSLCGPSIERIEEKNGEILYDIEITTNRVDTASVIGIAREAAAILPMFGKKAVFKKHELTAPSVPSSASQVSISITDPDGVCRRLLGIVMEVKGVEPSPEYMSKRVLATDTRSINNLVDITNYVMTEIGHPCHVFNYDRITTHKLILRHAKKGEEIVTLDEKKYILDEQDIIIDDGTGKIIDLPGIMGTANSVVTNDTKRILFFIESNDPVAIRRTSMKYGIRTMASTINEKNPDPELAYQAFLRGIELFTEVAEGKVVSKLIDVYPKKATTTQIKTSKSFIDERAGVAIPTTTITSILKNLDFGVEVKEENQLIVTVPTHRTADVSIPEDIVEEVTRVYGYFAIPSLLPPLAYVKQPEKTEWLFHYQYEIKSYLKNRGLSEVMNYSAVSRELLRAFEIDTTEHLYITNSISEDIKYLRRSLIPSLVKNIKQNEGFSQMMRLFEIAKIYDPKGGGLPDEKFMLSVAVNTDFDDLKQIVYGIFKELNIEINIMQSKGGCCAFFLDSVEGSIMVNNELFGSFGQVRPALCRNWGIENKQIFAAELFFEKIMQVARRMPVYKAFSSYAHITQDLTITKSMSFGEMKKKAFDASKKLISFNLLTTYKDTVTVRLKFTDNNRNITEEEVKGEVKKIQSKITNSQ